MADYTNIPYKLYNAGLNVALPPDIIGDSKYTRLTNVRNLQEGQIVSRYGLVRSPWGTNCGWIIFMRKLNDQNWLFVLSNGQVFVNDSPLMIYDDVYGVGNRVGTDENPNPEEGTFPRYPLVLTIPDNGVPEVALVKFANSYSGEDWAFFATEDGMWKIDKDGIAYKWGIRPPVTVSLVDEKVLYEPAFLTAEVIDCPPDDEGDYGCGLDGQTDNTVPYRWVYTYYNSRMGSESNPSDEMTTEVADLQPTEYDEDDLSKLVKRGQAVKLTGFVKPTDPQVDRIRIYRYGGSLNEYLLEQEVPWDVVTFTSWMSDSALRSQPVLSFDNDVPFTSLVPANQAPDLPEEFITRNDEFGVIEPVSLFETAMGRAWGPFAGSYIFAAGDPYRPSVVYWTNYGSPDGAANENEVSVCANSEPIQNGFVFGGNSFVFTKDNLYALDWGGPTAVPEFVPRQVPMGQGLSAPEAFAVGTQGVFFLSKDGIYVTDCTSFSESITNDSLRPIFLGHTVSLGDVDSENPEFHPFDWDHVDTVYMAVAAQELHFVYWARIESNKVLRRRSQAQTYRERVHLVYDILAKRWQRFKPAGELETTFVYSSENESRYKIYMALDDGFVYYVADGQPGLGYNEDTGAYFIVDFEEGDQISKESPIDAVVPFHCQFRTGAADLGNPLSHKEFGVLMVDADTLGKDVTITPYYDNETVRGEPLVLNTRERQVKTFSLGDVYYKNLSLDFQWDGKATFYQITGLCRIDEEEIVHWEHPDTSMKIPGWKHIRDLYVGLRSWDTVRLRIEVDGKAYDYFLPQTNGQRRKVYVKLDPTKGKVFRFLLDSNYEYMEGPDLAKKIGPPFRMYKDDSYYYVKPWHTGNTYQKIQLGGEGGAF